MRIRNGTAEQRRPTLSVCVFICVYVCLHMSAVLGVLDLGAQLTDLLKSSTMTTARSSVAMAMPTAFTKGSQALKNRVN